MSNSRKPESPHRLDVKVGWGLEIKASGYGVLVLLLATIGFGLGRAAGVW